jgi:hypothetical protein
MYVLSSANVCKSSDDFAVKSFSVRESFFSRKIFSKMVKVLQSFALQSWAGYVKMAMRLRRLPIFTSAYSRLRRSTRILPGAAAQQRLALPAA